MNDIQLIITAAFVGVTSLFLMVGILASRRGTVGVRVDELSQERSNQRSAAGGSMSGGSMSGGSTASGSMASRWSRIAKPASLSSEKEKVSLVERITQAGFYKRQTVILYHIIRFSLAILPVVIGCIAYQMGYVSFQRGVIYGGFTSVFGTLAPSFWLDFQKNKRQTQLRRALPDALDIIVICVEAGLSLPAAMNRVSKELGTAHPMLATEMGICQREIQLGASPGEALRRLADRFDVGEMRSMASVVQQAERFGASIVQALRVHAETLRIKRFQLAEEKAQKAAVKLVFPTVLCIFPALFIVLAGPAVYRIFEMLDKMVM